MGFVHDPEGVREGGARQAEYQSLSNFVHVEIEFWISEQSEVDRGLPCDAGVAMLFAKDAVIRGR